MINLQGFEPSYIPETPHCGGILKALLAVNFLFYQFSNAKQVWKRSLNWLTDGPTDDGGVCMQKLTSEPLQHTAKQKCLTFMPRVCI